MSKDLEPRNQKKVPEEHKPQPSTFRLRTCACGNLRKELARRNYQPRDLVDPVCMSKPTTWPAEYGQVGGLVFEGLGRSFGVGQYLERHE